MVYRFVKQSKGYITIASQPGAGATFKLYLPVGEKGKTIEPDTVIVADNKNITGGVVLVVEDEDGVRVLGSRILTRRGFHVLVAENGHAGLELLKAHEEVDFLLTDVMLPGGMSDRQLADAALSEHAALRVVFMSGYPKDTIVSQGRIDVDVRLLSKPFTPDALIQCVKDALGGADDGTTDGTTGGSTS